MNNLSQCRQKRTEQLNMKFGHVAFTARCYASAVYAVVVCLSVCVWSVTLRYCIKMAKRIITQTEPHNSPETLVFDVKHHSKVGITTTRAPNAGGVG